jgi:3-hydroxyisobutyrate dehydrogenase
MQVAQVAMQEFEEAMRRGWGERDSRTPMLLQEERAGVSPRVPAEKLQEILG